MVDFIGEELRSFYEFLKYPRQDIFKEKLSLKNVFPLISSYYIVFIAGIIILTPFASLIGLEDIPHKLEDLKDINKWLMILLAVFTQPFLEELFFRFPLKYKRGLIVLVITMIGMVIYLGLNKFTEDSNKTTAIALISTIILISIFLSVSRTQVAQFKLDLLIKKYFPHIFYAIAVYFAYIHFFNFEAEGNQWLFTPIMVFPQFLIALFVGYTRLKYGFLSAVVIHMINNLIPTLVILFVKPETMMGFIA